MALFQSVAGRVNLPENPQPVVINPRERVRAMELYAAFKVAETLRHGFRGFSSGGGPLA